MTQHTSVLGRAVTAASWSETQTRRKAMQKTQLSCVTSFSRYCHFDHGLPSEVLEQSFGVRQEQQGFSSLNLFRQSEAWLPFGRDHRPCARGPPCTGDRPLPSQALAVHVPTLLRRSRSHNSITASPVKTSGGLLCTRSHSLCS